MGPFRSVAEGGHARLAWLPQTHRGRPAEPTPHPLDPPRWHDAAATRAAHDDVSVAHAPSDAAAVAPGLPMAALPLDGVLTSGQPTEWHLRHIAAAGFRTILDLRIPAEPRGFDEPALARELGLEYVNVPIAGAAIPEHHFARVREVLRDPAKRPLAFHCTDANRVGALLLPYLVLDEGMPTEQALRVCQYAGLRTPELAHAALLYVKERR